jgi:hypothetical protein
MLPAAITFGIYLLAHCFTSMWAWETINRK